LRPENYVDPTPRKVPLWGQRADRVYLNAVETFAPFAALVILIQLTGKADAMTAFWAAWPSEARGKLRIGDDWNAITIIALSHSSPLKAIAELVENSIDAKARNVAITRGRDSGRHFLAIRDDGEGVPPDCDGRPDFPYVATHICDSVKHRLKAEGKSGLQGEFGIGLLSFWTLGDELTMTSTGVDQRAYQMVMRRGDPSYAVAPRRALFGEGGTEVRIAPLLDGVRALSGEKIQWYLAAELRDRIRRTGVRINVVDRLARKQSASSRVNMRAGSCISCP
jgi:Histidine kinase-, DNA gyrase B-, and HSP90-like ATPase/MAPEG family